MRAPHAPRQIATNQKPRISESYNTLAAFVLNLAVAVAASGCAAPSCEELGEDICARACECNDCTFATRDPFQVVDVSDYETCVRTFRDSCPRFAEGDIDYAACESSLDHAECRRGAFMLFLEPECEGIPFAAAERTSE